MKLLKLALENFQPHERLEVDLSAQLVSISGASDVGKSSVLRALRWLCLNDLPGDDFVREGAKRTTVTLTLSGNRVIKRIRGSGTNTYELDGKEFKSFGNTVPQDIAALLQLTNLNFQSQHDSPFWFAESAPEVSRQLNAVIDLSVIDSSLSFVAAKVRSAQERVNVTQERLDEAKKELEEIEPQRQRIRDFAQIIKQQDELETVQTDCSRLAGVRDDIRRHRSNLRRQQEQAEAGREMLEAGRMYLRILQDCERLAWQLEKFKTTAVAVKQNTQATKQAEERMHREMKGQKCPTCGQQFR
jgi:DNA repair exonuclease SbcCD ATPase subunit